MLTDSAVPHPFPGIPVLGPGFVAAGPVGGWGGDDAVEELAAEGEDDGAEGPDVGLDVDGGGFGGHPGEGAGPVAVLVPVWVVVLEGEALDGFSWNTFSKGNGGRSLRSRIRSLSGMRGCSGLFFSEVLIRGGFCGVRWLVPISGGLF